MNLYLPFFDPNARRSLESVKKKVKEEKILDFPSTEDQIESTPKAITLAIMLFAKNHMQNILQSEQKIISEIKEEQKINLYLELLAAYYFLVSINLQKHFSDSEQFLLFFLRIHVEMLNNLPRTDDTLWLYDASETQDIEQKVSDSIWRGERFYMQNILNDQEKADIERLVKRTQSLDYEKSLFTQIIIKNYYRTSKILNLTLSGDDLFAMHFLFTITNVSIIEYQKIIRKMKPVWHEK